jgi:hypothetical protein
MLLYTAPARSSLLRTYFWQYPYIHGGVYMDVNIALFCSSKLVIYILSFYQSIFTLIMAAIVCTLRFART